MRLTALRRFRWLFRQFATANLLVLASVSIGTIGFALITDATWFDAFYMTIVTLSTVGYGEVIALDTSGRLFASLLILFNLGAFAYAFTSITGFLVDGNGRQAWRIFRMQQRIDRLQDHVIICGYGRLGRQVAEGLRQEERNFVVIESENPTKADEARKDLLYIKGDALKDQLLRDAGIDRAAALVAALPKDTDNVYLILTARELNSKLEIISRVSSPDVEPRMRHAGASHVIMPERIGGQHIARLITRPDVVRVIDLLTEGNANAVFHEIYVRDLPANLQSSTLEELRDRCGASINIVGLHQGDEIVVNPERDYRPKAEEGLILLGTAEQVARFRELAKVHPEQ